MKRVLPGLALVSSLLLLVGAKPVRAPRVATLAIPGPRPLVRVARDVVDVAFQVDPSLASGAGLFEDAVRVPSYSPTAVAALTERLDRDLAELRAMPLDAWTIDQRIDARYVGAVAENVRRQLQVERLYERRPAQWLEPVGNNLIALTSYAPDQPELQDGVYALIPGMIAEMGEVMTAPTRRDVETGAGIADALATMATARGATPAAAALTTYAAHLRGLSPAGEFAVIGAESYAWRLRHALLLPWTPEELHARATAALAAVDAELATLPPRSPATSPLPGTIAFAQALDRDALLGLYDSIEEANRAATVKGRWVTIPAEVGPIHARETPEAMVPLTGDGGSMNPPPTYAASNVGYWNVEHFSPAWPEDERLRIVTSARGFFSNGMGTYSAHEGFPGHHLQLAIARLHPDPLRSILPDPVLNEGWALYAEEVFADHGGLAATPDARRTVLGSYRGRIRRVLYDVPIETGAWTLQQAADFKYDAAPGEGRVDEDILRSINWPAQLICYFAGKTQIVELREAWRAKVGAAYDERRFHDALLAEGSIPIALIRAKMLGEPLPAW